LAPSHVLGFNSSSILPAETYEAKAKYPSEVLAVINYLVRLSFIVLLSWINVTLS